MDRDTERSHRSAEPSISRVVTTGTDGVEIERTMVRIPLREEYVLYPQGQSITSL